LLELRRRGATPVIMSTALGDDLEKLTALRIGADDYMVKPYNPMELVARVKAVLRRTAGDVVREVIRLGMLEIDLVAHQIRIAATGGVLAVEVTPTEFRILAHMARAPHKAFTRGEIADACLPRDGNALDRTVDSHIAKLRAKLKAGGLGRLLEGVRGVGYRLGTS
jgi:two-component system, OmpR family, response regulator AdeR